MVPVRNRKVAELIAQLHANIGFSRQLCEDAHRIRAESLRLLSQLDWEPGTVRESGTSKAGKSRRKVDE